MSCYETDCMYRKHADKAYRVGVIMIHPLVAIASRSFIRSIEADEQHARVDAMKKRAIMSCSSYDQFRHMVDCAHLMKVT